MHPKKWGSLLLLSALLATPMAMAQDATKADLDAAEGRLASSITNATADASADADVIIGRLTILQNEINEIQAQYLDVLDELQTLRNETYADHVDLYSVLVDDQGNPRTDAIEAALITLIESQDQVVTSQFRIRGDLDNATTTMEQGFSVINDGNEAIYTVADASNGSVGFLKVSMAMNVLLTLFLVSYITKRPRRLWRRVEMEQRKLNAHMGPVTPMCPQEDEGLALGDYYSCPVAEDCPVAESCKHVAMDNTEARVMAEAEMERQLEETPVVKLPTPEAESIAEPEGEEEEEEDELAAFGQGA